MPPLYKINLRRNVGNRSDSRNIYYLTEGTVSEMNFFDALFNFTNYFNNKGVNLIKCEKTGNDEGVSNFNGLIKLAKKYIESSKDFKIGYDKVLIVFDLDTYINNLQEVIDLIECNKDNIIFGYTNPSFEVLILMCLEEGSLSLLKEYERNAIIQNEFVGRERYIYYLIKQKYGFDSKNHSEDFLKVAKKFNNAINQNVNIYIDRAISEITCNVHYVLESIKNNNIDEIEYFSCNYTNLE